MIMIMSTSNRFLTLKEMKKTNAENSLVLGSIRLHILLFYISVQD